MKRVLLMLVALFFCLSLGACGLYSDEQLEAIREEAYQQGLEETLEKSEEEYQEFLRQYEIEMQEELRELQRDAAEKREAAEEAEEEAPVSDDVEASSEEPEAPESSSSSETSSESVSAYNGANPDGIANSATMVYVTDYGEKYHSYGCQYLAVSCHGMTLYQAKQAGYTACSVCDPPA